MSLCRAVVVETAHKEYAVVHDRRFVRPLRLYYDKLGAFKNRIKLGTSLHIRRPNPDEDVAVPFSDPVIAHDIMEKWRGSGIGDEPFEIQMEVIFPSPEEAVAVMDGLNKAFSKTYGLVYVSAAFGTIFEAKRLSIRRAYLLWVTWHGGLTKWVIPEQDIVMVPEKFTPFLEYSHILDKSPWKKLSNFKIPKPEIKPSAISTVQPTTNPKTVKYLGIVWQKGEEFYQVYMPKFNRSATLTVKKPQKGANYTEATLGRHFLVELDATGKEVVATTATSGSDGSVLPDYQIEIHQSEATILLNGVYKGVAKYNNELVPIFWHKRFSNIYDSQKFCAGMQLECGHLCRFSMRRQETNGKGGVWMVRFVTRQQPNNSGTPDSELDILRKAQAQRRNNHNRNPRNNNYGSRQESRSFTEFGKSPGFGCAEKTSQKKVEEEPAYAPQGSNTAGERRSEGRRIVFTDEEPTGPRQSTSLAMALGVDPWAPFPALLVTPISAPELHPRNRVPFIAPRPLITCSPPENADWDTVDVEAREAQEREQERCRAEKRAEEERIREERRKRAAELRREIEATREYGEMMAVEERKRAQAIVDLVRVIDGTEGEEEVEQQGRSSSYDLEKKLSGCCLTDNEKLY